MRLHEREMPLDPEVERELDAIDRALAGEPVDADLAVLAELALELRSERPEPTAEVEAKLDVLAAAGFPPRASDRLGHLRRRGADTTSRPQADFATSGKRAAALGDLSVGPNNRKIAQNVDLGLSTSPDAFRDAADGVLDVVRDHRGFVVRSNVSGGDPGVSGAK